jgi:hypothetical protein
MIIRIQNISSATKEEIRKQKIAVIQEKHEI